MVIEYFHMLTTNVGMKLKITYYLKPVIKAAFLLGFLLSGLCIAQDPPKPTACTDAPEGFSLGGRSTGPPSLCSTPDNPNADYTVAFIDDPTTVPGGGVQDPESVQFVWDYSDATDITAPDFTGEVRDEIGTYWSKTKSTTPGVHWVLIIAEKGAQKYLGCRRIEVIRTDPPVAEIYTCNGTEVTIDIPTDEANEHNGYKIEWGDGTVEDVPVNATTLPYNKTHTYTGALPDVTVTGFYIRNTTIACTTNPEVKKVDANKTPVITNLKSIDGGAEIKFKNFSPTGLYTLQAAEDNGATYNWDDYGQSTDGEFTISSLNKEVKHCYRVAIEDACGLPILSNIACDIGVDASLSSSSEVTISWSLPSSPSGIPTQLELDRDEDDCGCAKSLPLNSNRDSTFNDVSLDCNKSYTFQVKAKFTIEVNGNKEFLTVVSEIITIDPKDDSVVIIPNGLVNASFPANDDSIIKLILLDPSNAIAYNFYHKGEVDDDFEKIGSSEMNNFEDIAIQSNSGAYCYKYKLEDACGTTSDLSPEFCTVFLSHEGTTLNWTDFSFPNTILTSTPAEYTLESYDQYIGIFIPQIRTSDLSYGIALLISDSENPTIKFRILAQQFVDVGGTNFAIPSYSNTVEVPIPANIFIPTAFSPNGDGDNETFKINSKFVDMGIITIYDRWGAIIYSGDIDGESWDGSNGNTGVLVPSGNYTYRIKGFSLAGEDFGRTGVLTVLR
ncbi:MAG: gliding motility-associated-like protein [Arcticibacterium sp.]|jgi:gliding motility-associated-like protein